MSKPQLIIISGPPAAGKTSSARPLADALGYPLLGMDDVKERLADAIGPAAANFNAMLGDAAVHQLMTLGREILASGRDVILEGFFQSDRYSDKFAELAMIADTVLVHLLAEDAVLKHRYEDRARRGERHWIHGDAEKIGTLKPELPAYMAKRLHLDVPQIVIDTTSTEVDIRAIAQLILQTRSTQNKSA